MMDLTKELSAVLVVSGRTFEAIRACQRAHATGGRGDGWLERLWLPPGTLLRDAGYIADSLHNLQGLGNAVSAGDLSEARWTCDLLVGVYEAVDSGRVPEVLAAFRRLEQLYPNLVSGTLTALRALQARLPAAVAE